MRSQIVLSSDEKRTIVDYLKADDPRADEMMADLGLSTAQVNELRAEAARQAVQPPVPASVTRRQARLALNAAGLLNEVEAAIAASGREAQIWYEDSAEWLRVDPILNQLAATLNLTQQQVDDLFRSAATY